MMYDSDYVAVVLQLFIVINVSSLFYRPSIFFMNIITVATVAVVV